MANLRTIDGLMKDLEGIISTATDGKGVEDSGGEKDDRPKFIILKEKVNEELTELRSKVEYFHSGTFTENVEEKERWKREIKEYILSVRTNINEMAQEVVNETISFKDLHRLLKKDQNIVWEVALVGVGDIEVEGGLSTYLCAIEELEGFDEITESGGGDGTMEDMFGLLDPQTPEDEALVKKLFNILDRDGNGLIGLQDYYSSHKVIQVLVRNAKAMFLLKKQVDYLDYKYSPHNFKHKAKSGKGTGAFALGAQGVATFGSQEKGRAQKIKEQREEKRKGGNYKPIDASEDEKQFLQEYDEWQYQFDEQLDELIVGIQRINAINIDIKDELELQGELAEELEDRLQVVDQVIVNETERLKDLLDKSGGASKWCPRFIAFVILFAIVGYLLQKI